LPSRNEEERPLVARPLRQPRVRSKISRCPGLHHTGERLPYVSIQIDEQRIRPQGVEKRDSQGVLRRLLEDPDGSGGAAAVSIPQFAIEIVRKTSCRFCSR